MSVIQELLQKLVTTAVQFVPDEHPDPLRTSREHIGAPIDRVDGPDKVAGRARFTDEYALDDPAYAALVLSTIPKGVLTSIETGAAESAPGVLAVLTHENCPRMKAPPEFNGPLSGAAASKLPVLQDESVHWNGQPVAVVVAETLEQAEHAATLVRTTYREERAVLSLDEARKEKVSVIQGEPGSHEVGHAEEELARSDVVVDHRYTTPPYNHNAIEPHATVAVWSEEHGLTVLDASQTVVALRGTLAKMFSLDPKRVRVLAPFVGGGFGGKGTMWWHTALCAAAAKVVGRAVKLSLPREVIFRIVGGRTPTRQRVALGAGRDGKLRALIHQGLTATTEQNEFPEQFTFPARHLYAAPNLLVSQEMVKLDTVANTFMRAPGESVGSFALESAVDELAYKLGIDPVALRRMNEPERDPTKKTRFSSRHLVEAYRRGAEAFGWHERPFAPLSQRHGDWLIGQGVATAYYPYYRMPAAARVELTPGGRARVQAAAQEMGMGTATVQIQHAAQRLGLPLANVTFEYGDSDLPAAPLAGGSNQTASNVAAVTAAIAKLHNRLLGIAKSGSPLRGLSLEEVEARDGGLYRRDDGRGQTYGELMAAADRDKMEAEASAPPPIELVKYSMHSYGAQFCEVRVHAVTGEVRVTRWVAALDTGRILNKKTATSQLRGGIVMGIGMALTEESLYDERYGKIINATLAEYHVPVHLDVPDIEVLFLDIPDDHAPLGVRGIGEIGITGTAAAVANAVFHATGKRVRDLPITLDKLL